MTVVMSAQSQTSECEMKSSVNNSKAVMFMANRVIQWNTHTHFLFELVVPTNCITVEALLKG